jgi:hypothetical protein
VKKEKQKSFLKVTIRGFREIRKMKVERCVLFLLAETRETILKKNNFFFIGG